MKDEKFLVQKSQVWREPGVLQLWKKHLTHMKRQQMPENLSMSIREDTDVELEEMDDVNNENVVPTIGMIPVGKVF